MVQVCLAPGRNADALVVMSHPFFENSPQVPIIQWNQEIQALTLRLSTHGSGIGDSAALPPRKTKSDLCAILV